MGVQVEMESANIRLEEKEPNMIGAPGSIASKEEVNDTNVLGQVSKDIKEWLKELDLAQYYDKFVDNDFDSLKRIQKIRDEHTLEKIGIDSIGHRVAIWSAIRDLQDGSQQQEMEGISP